MSDYSEIATAYRYGRLLGGSPEGWAGLCPYDHAEYALRVAWLAGFSEGRGLMAERRNPLSMRSAAERRPDPAR